MQCVPPFADNIPEAKIIQLSFERPNFVFARDGVQLWLKLSSKPRTDACLLVARFLQQLYETKDPLVQNITVDNSDPNTLRIVHHLMDMEEYVPRLTELMRNRHVPFEWLATRNEKTSATVPQQLGIALGSAAVGAVGASLLQAGRDKEQCKEQQMEVRTLTAALNQTNLDRERMQAQIAQLNILHDRLRLERIACDSLRKTYEAQNNVLKQCQNKFEQQSQILTACQAQNEALTQEATKYQDNLIEARRELQDMKVAVTAAHLQVATLEKEAAKQREEAAQAKKTFKAYGTCTSQLAATVVWMEEKEVTIRKLRRQLGDCRGEGKLEEIVENLRVQTQENKENAQALKASRLLETEAVVQKEECEAELKVAKEECETLKTKLLMDATTMMSMDEEIKSVVNAEVTKLRNERVQPLQEMMQLRLTWLSQVDIAATKIFTPRPVKGPEEFYTKLIVSLDNFITESNKIIQGISTKSIDESGKNAYVAYIATEAAAREYVVVKSQADTNIRETFAALQWKQNMVAWMKEIDTLSKTFNPRKTTLIAPPTFPGILVLPTPPSTPDVSNPFAVDELKIPREALQHQLNLLANTATNVKIENKNKSSLTDLKRAIATKSQEAKQDAANIDAAILTQTYQTVQILWVYFEIIFRQWRIPAFQFLEFSAAAS